MKRLIKRCICSNEGQCLLIVIIGLGIAITLELLGVL